MPPPSTPPAAGRRVLRVCVPPLTTLQVAACLNVSFTLSNIYYLNIINATLRIGRYFIVFYLVFSFVLASVFLYV